MIGITLGDANGVGPEILLRAFQENLLPGQFLVIGDYPVLEACNEQLSLDAPIRKMMDEDDYQPEYINVYDLILLRKEDITPGRIAKKVGSAALEYVRKSTRLALDGFLAAIVTLPINKEAVRLTMEDFTGHTGFIASLCDITNYTMMLASRELIVTHCSTHVSLRDAIALVTKDRVYDVIRLTDDAVKKLRSQARIAVAGLNPHAGEHGAFGDEEEKAIAPAVEKARKTGLDVTGPEAPDTVFYRAVNARYDAVVCMYHDQGHIPMKLSGFEEGVNVTLGLPIIRTSVDHGTAYDIAYQGIASVKSFHNAYEMAKQLTG
ncbi:MAG TPA: 4-hydroxythreonine-4-phosphate dehydrogenase PdxA [bacterium]|nr:4-hydroxythreonine-4-phosphate dehydrogenase PdxA [bacterium]